MCDGVCVCVRGCVRVCVQACIGVFRCVVRVNMCVDVKSLCECVMNASLASPSPQHCAGLDFGPRNVVPFRSLDNADLLRNGHDAQIRMASNGAPHGRAGPMLVIAQVL